MHVLVTGGAGYIGAHTCKLLSQRGYTPVCYDNFSRGNNDTSRYGPVVNGDISDTSRMLNTAHKYGIQAIIHLAALARVDESVKFPLWYYRTNVAHSLCVSAVANTRKIPLVFASTCAVYGKPKSPYGRSKLVFEHVLADEGVATDLRWAALRYFNVAGSDPDGEFGETERVVPAVLKAAASETLFTINGTDYDTPDGTCVRDYVHVMDVACANVTAAEYLVTGGAPMTVDICSGETHSVREVVTAAETVLNRAIEVVEAPRRAGDIPAVAGDSAMALKTLGWIPSRSLETMIGDTWRWMQKVSHA